MRTAVPRTASRYPMRSTLFPDGPRCPVETIANWLGKRNVPESQAIEPDSPEGISPKVHPARLAGRCGDYSTATIALNAF